MNWIVIAIMAAIIVFLTALSMWCAKKEDEMLKDLRIRLRDLENRNREEQNNDKH